MSDDAKWIIGLLALPMAGLISWAFWVHYELKSLRRHHNVLNENQNFWLKELLALRDKWIEKYGRNGGHK